MWSVSPVILSFISKSVNYLIMANYVVHFVFSL